MKFLIGNVPSSKNSKINTSRGSFMSKTVKKYLRSYGIQTFSSRRKEVKGYKTIPMTFPVEELRELLSDVEYPVVLGLHFVRGSRHKFDFHNACQIILDLFTAFEIIPDDNMDYVIPRAFKIDDNYYSYEPKNPGVWVTIIKE
jgi:hypothetical protein